VWKLLEEYTYNRAARSNNLAIDLRLAYQNPEGEVHEKKGEHRGAFLTKKTRRCHEKWTAAQHRKWVSSSITNESKQKGGCKKNRGEKKKGSSMKKGK